jgi:dipeptidase E
MMLPRLLLLVALFLPAARLAASPAFVTSPAASVLVVGGSMMNGNHFADSTLPALRQHYEGCRRIALVLHASHPHDRDRIEARLQRAFQHMGGMAAESLHRHDAAGAERLLREADGIFVGGGETFVLLRTLYETGQLQVLQERVLAGVPYGGSSAGANVAGLLIGTTNDFPVTDVPTRTALAIFPAVINPHHPRPEAAADFRGRAGKIRTYLSFNPSERVLALGDAAIARLHDGAVRIERGPAWLYSADTDRELVEGEPVLELGGQSAAHRAGPNP